MKGLGTGLVVVLRKERRRRKARENEVKEGKGVIERKTRNKEEVRSLLKVEMKTRLFLFLFLFFPFVTRVSPSDCSFLARSLTRLFVLVRIRSFVRSFVFFLFVSATCSVMADQRQERNKKIDLDYGLCIHPLSLQKRVVFNQNSPSWPVGVGVSPFLFSPVAEQPREQQPSTKRGVSTFPRETNVREGDEKETRERESGG